MRHLVSTRVTLFALSLLITAPAVGAQATAVAITPQILTIERAPDGSSAHPMMATLQVGHTDPRPNCAKVTRVAVMQIGAAGMPFMFGTRDLPSGGLCSWNESAVSMSVEPFRNLELPACGSTASVPLVIALIGPKSPTIVSTATDAYNSVLSQVMGGPAQGSAPQYTTVATRNVVVQAHVDCSGGGSTSSGQSNGSGAPVHQAHPAGSSSGTSSGSNVHTAVAVGGTGNPAYTGRAQGTSQGTSQGGNVHAALPPASLSLSVPQYAGRCPVSLSAQGSYTPSMAGTANVVWKFGDGATSTSQTPVTASTNTIGLAQRVTASRNTTLTLTVTTGGITSTQTVPFGVHCE